MVGAIHFAHSTLLYILLPLLVGVIGYRWFFYKPVIYRYTLVSLMRKMGVLSSSFSLYCINIIRALLLIVLAFLMLKPQVVDRRSQLPVEGIDIMMVLDLSGSMQAFDDPKNQKSRLSIAKEEAIRFIDKRQDDTIGLVVFGQNAISRAPLTLDKKILIDIINDLELGNTVDPNGTVLAKSLVMALNRLKESSVTSKIIIMLTDGEPTPHDIPHRTALDIANKMGVKIYTIGVGGDQGGYVNHPFWGLTLASPPLNTQLLEEIAHKTGGKFFRTRNQQEMRDVYTTIDQLEKTEKETDMYAQYIDIFMPFLWMALILVSSLLLLTTFVWRVVL